MIYQLTSKIFMNVHAACPDVTIGGYPIQNPITNTFTDNCTALSTPGGIITEVLPIVFSILGFLTVIFIVISGIQFITSTGDPKAVAGARARLIYAIVGFAIIILAYLISQYVNKVFLGTEVIQ